MVSEVSERRSGDDRRIVPRRADSERRCRSRRTAFSNVNPDLRVVRDRRNDQRRGVYDRRGRIARRLTDRRRETPAAFSREDTARIRLMMSQSPPVVACPICFSRLPVERPESVMGTEIWEVRCTDCNRTALITETPGQDILVIDSNAIVRDALALVLQRAGHRVHGAGSAAAAIAQFDQSPPDVVVLDLDVGGRGLDILRTLVQKKPDTVFIVVTVKGRIGAPDPAVAARGLGTVVIMRKPFSPPAILEVLDRALP